MDVAVLDPKYAKARNIVSERERTHQGTATPERIVRAGEGFEKNVGKEGAQRMVDAPLDRMWKSGAITRTEFEAGDKFRGDAYLAAVDPGTGSVDWSHAGGGGRSSFVPSMFGAQHIHDARTRFREVERSFDGLVWTMLKNGLVHEHSLEEMGRACFARADKREAAVAGQAGFRTALAALADSYARGKPNRETRGRAA